MNGSRQVIQLSSCSLDMAHDVFRLPPRPAAIRGPDYEDQFDFTTVFCDVFWDAAGEHVVLIGPPLFNLATGMEFRALPSGGRCPPLHERKYWMDQVTLTPPSGSTGIEIRIGSACFITAIQPNLNHLFRDRRAIFTLSRNNDLQWIRDWVKFYVSVHGCNAVLLYDHMSDRYATAEIDDAIRSVDPSLQSVVLSRPFPYGVFDGRHELTYNIYDSFYGQSTLIEHARRRFLATAEGAINADLDELALAGGESIFDMLKTSPTGYLNYGGWWIVNFPQHLETPRRHRDFSYRRVDRPDHVETKWAISPSRCEEGMQWWVHWVSGARTDARSSEINIRHFKGINTDWDLDSHLRPGKRTDETGVQESQLAVDEELRETMAAIFADAAGAVAMPDARPPEFAAISLRRDSRKSTDASIALSAARRATELLPQHPGFRLNFAGLLANAGHEWEALDQQRIAAGLRDDDPLYHYQMGRSAFGRCDDRTGRNHMLRAIQLDPAFAEPYFALFTHYRNSGEELAARATAHDFARAASATAFAHETAAKMYFELSDFSASAGFARRSVELGGGWVAGQVLTMSLFHDKDIDAAIREQWAAIEAGRRGPTVRPTPTLIDGQRLPEIEMRVPFELLWSRLARFQLAAGQYARAEISAHEAIEANPSYYAGYMAMADILTVQGRPADAQTQFRQAVARIATLAGRIIRPQLAPRDYQLAELESLLESANVLARAGLPDQAELLVAKIMAHPSDVVRYTIEAAGLLDTLGKTDAALAHIVNLQSRLRDNWRLDWIAAQVEFHAGRLDRAIELARSAVALNPEFHDLRRGLAGFHAQKGDWTAAIAEYRKYLEQRPDDGDILYALSLALHESGNSEAAVAPALRAVAAQPDSADWQLHLGALLFHLKRGPESMAPLRRAIALSPGNAAPHYLLSHIHNQLGNADEATRSARQAVALQPGSSESLRHLGALLVLQGHYADAIETLTSCLDIEGSNSDALHLLSQCHIGMGNSALAIDMARRASALNPGYAAALEHLLNSPDADKAALSGVPIGNSAGD